MGVNKDLIGIDDITEETKKSFVITNANMANWAIKTIKHELEQCQTFVDVADFEIGQLKQQKQNILDKYESNTAFLRNALGDFMKISPCKTSKTQQKLVLPSGDVIMKFEKVDFDVEKDKLVNFLEQNNLEDFVKVEKSPMWGDFKKRLSIIDENVVDTETGEIMECIRVKYVPMKIEVK